MIKLRYVVYPFQLPGLPKATFFFINEEFQSNPYVLFSSSAPTPSIVPSNGTILFLPSFSLYLQLRSHTFYTKPQNEDLNANLRHTSPLIMWLYLTLPQPPNITNSMTPVLWSIHLCLPPSSAPLPFYSFSFSASKRSVAKCLCSLRVAVIELKTAPEDGMT